MNQSSSIAMWIVIPCYHDLGIQIYFSRCWDDLLLTCKENETPEPTKNCSPQTSMVEEFHPEKPP